MDRPAMGAWMKGVRKRALGRFRIRRVLNDEVPRCTATEITEVKSRRQRLTAGGVSIL